MTLEERAEEYRKEKLEGGNCVDALIKALNQKETIFTCFFCLKPLLLALMFLNQFYLCLSLVKCFSHECYLF